MTRNTQKTNETFSLPFYNCKIEQELNRLLRLNQFALFYMQKFFSLFVASTEEEMRKSDANGEHRTEYPNY